MEVHPEPWLTAHIVNKENTGSGIRDIPAFPYVWKLGYQVSILTESNA